MLKGGVQLCFDRAAIIKIQCRKVIVFNRSTAGKQTRDEKGILQFLFHITVFGVRNHNKLSGQCQFIRKNAKAAFPGYFESICTGNTLE